MEIMNKDQERTLGEQVLGYIAELEEENKKLKEENQYRESIADVLPEGEGHIAEETIQDLQDRINELIGKIDQLEEENENLSKDLFHLTNDGQRRNPTATSRAEGVKGEGGEEQGKNARDS